MAAKVAKIRAPEDKRLASPISTKLYCFISHGPANFAKLKQREMKMVVNRYSFTRFKLSKGPTAL